MEGGSEGGKEREREGACSVEGSVSADLPAGDARTWRGRAIGSSSRPGVGGGRSGGISPGQGRDAVDKAPGSSEGEEGQGAGTFP